MNKWARANWLWVKDGLSLIAGITKKNRPTVQAWFRVSHLINLLKQSLNLVSVELDTKTNIAACSPRCQESLCHKPGHRPRLMAYHLLYEYYIFSLFACQEVTVIFFSMTFVMASSC